MNTGYVKIYPKVDVEEIRVDIPPLFLLQEIIVPQPVQQVEENEQHNRDGSLPPENISIENAVEAPQPAPLEKGDLPLQMIMWCIYRNLILILG